MLEIKINNQYSLYYRKLKSGNYDIELHDFYNLIMRKTIETKETFKDIIKKPQDYIDVIFYT